MAVSWLQDSPSCTVPGAAPGKTPPLRLALEQGQGPASPLCSSSCSPRTLPFGLTPKCSGPPPQNRTIFTIQLLPSAPSSHHLSPELVSLLLPRPPTVWSTQQPERTSPKSHHAPRRIHPTAPHFHFLPLPFTPLRPHGPLAAPQPPRASPRPTSQPGSALHLGQSWDRLPGPGELCSLSDHEPWPQCHPLFRPPPGQPRPALGHSPLPSICCL